MFFQKVKLLEDIAEVSQNNQLKIAVKNQQLKDQDLVLVVSQVVAYGVSQIPCESEVLKKCQNLVSNLYRRVLSEGNSPPKDDEWAKVQFAAYGLAAREKAAGLIAIAALMGRSVSVMDEGFTAIRAREFFKALERSQISQKKEIYLNLSNKLLDLLKKASLVEA